MSGSIPDSVLNNIAHPATVNLLQDYKGASDAAQGIWANRASQANALRGNLLQQATGADGTVDMAAFNRLAAGAGPAYAPAAAAGLEQSTAIGGQQQTQALKSLTATSTALDSLGPNATHQQVVDVLNEGQKAGWIQPQGAQSILVGMPDGDDPRSQATRQHILQTIGDRLRTASERLQSQYGQPQMPSIGGALVPGATNQRTGAFTPAGPQLAVTPTPGERNLTQQTWNPVTRQFEATPRQQVAPMVDGQGNPLPGSAVPGLPASGRPAPAGTAATPAPQTNIAQPSPGTEDEMRGSTAHVLAARDRANNYQANIYPVEGAITALQGADTGKGGEVLNNIRGYLGDTPLKYLSNFLPSSLSDQDKRSLYDEANKYTTGMAQAVPGASGSDARSATAAAATPSVHISNAAALAVSKSILAQKRMEQAGTLAFNQTGQAPGDYDRFMNTWATNQDPRGFMADRMSGPERAAMVKQMGGVGSAAYQRFKASYLAGVAAKVTDAAN